MILPICPIIKFKTLSLDPYTIIMYRIYILYGKLPGERWGNKEKSQEEEEE
jgi:hypothetical protein